MRQIFILASSFWLLTSVLRAQTFNTGGTAALGNFLNPLTVTTTSPFDVCNYDLIQIDLAQGKVFARPYRNGAGNICNSTALVDITAQTFGTPPAGPINDGVLEVADFTLRQSTLAGAPTPSTLTLNFRPNANNTPVWIRATGNVTIESGTTLSVAGQIGGTPSGALRGAGGRGGPGGYRGGDGGNGGISPSAGSAGFGPGGGPGGAIGDSARDPAKFLTTGTDVDGTGPLPAIPAGNDLLTSLRGGSGGGGGGGASNFAGAGGGGGGGAILIAASDTITVNGSVTAKGGDTPSATYRGAGGTGGVIRLVAATIAGSGPLDASRGVGAFPISDNGIARLEAFTISSTGLFLSGTNVSAASAPGQIILPSAPLAFLRFARLTDSSDGNNFVDVPAASQATAGRTGILNPVDVTLPNTGGTPASTVTVNLVAGPNLGPPNGFPAGKSVTLIVTPLDPAQGASQSYTGAISCQSPPTDCAASVTGVTLPLGFSSMSAFTVLSMSQTGALARLFPKMYQGEPIESVRLQTNGKETEYVLIAESGREFPYKPGR